MLRGVGRGRKLLRIASSNTDRKTLKHSDLTYSLQTNRSCPDHSAIDKKTDSNDCPPMSGSDVENFQGKIVYNPDGSAYIINTEDGSTLNASDSHINVDACCSNSRNTIRVPVTSIKKNLNPKIHSFRVVTAKDAYVNLYSALNPLNIQKPVLMCFICKLSFGNTKSFSLHANIEHELNLEESEKRLLSREYSSAIIQRNVDEQPQISFLQPLNVDFIRDQLSGLIEPKTPSSTQSVEKNTAKTNITTKTLLTFAQGSTTGASSDHEIDKDNISKNILRMSSNASDEPQNNPKILQEQNMLNVDLSTNTSTTATLVVARVTEVLSPLSSSSSTVPTTLIYSTLSTTTETTTALTKNVIDIKEIEVPSAKTAASSMTNINISMCNRDSSSTDDLSSKSTLTRTTTPTPTVAPSPLSAPTATTSCSGTPHSPQPSTIIPGGYTVVDYLQQHLQQEFQRIPSSPGSSTPTSLVAVSSRSTSCGSDKAPKTMLQQYWSPTSSLNNDEYSPLRQHTSISSLHASLATLANDQNNSSNVKLINDFLQQQFSSQQLKQQNFYNLLHSCAEHSEIKGIDCKTCELIEVQRLTKNLRQQHSTTNIPCNMISNITSPKTNISVTALSTSVSSFSNSSTSVAAAGNSSSFTIGACPEHINGRPLGIDCTRF